MFAKKAEEAWTVVVRGWDFGRYGVIVVAGDAQVAW